jgi:predicted PurR-regulated permease PerM
VTGSSPLTTGEYTARRAAPLVPALLAALLLLFFLVRIGELVAVAFIAALLGVYLTAVTDLMSRLVRLPRGVALLLALLLTLGALTGVGALLAPPLVLQTQDLAAKVPEYLANLDRSIRDLAARYPVLRGTGIADGETTLLSALLHDLGDYLRRQVVGYATLSGKILIDGIAVLVMAFYAAYRPTVYTDGLIAVTPPPHRATARAILVDMGLSLRAWIGAQLTAMVFLGVLTGIGLWLLDVPYWLAFAIFAGVAVMVPFFGTITSTLLPALLVLGERGWLAFFAVASVGVVVHLVEANIVHPLLMQHRLAVPPVLTIFSVLVMAKVGGLLGMLVALPTMTTLLIVARHVLIQRIYGDAPPAVDPPVTRPPAAAAPPA